MKVTLHLAHTSPSKEKAYSSSRLIKVGLVVALSFPLSLPAVFPSKTNMLLLSCLYRHSWWAGKVQKQGPTMSKLFESVK